MAAPTNKSTINSSSSASTYTTSATFTPTVGELLIAVISVSRSTLAAPTFSLSDGSTFTLVGTGARSTRRCYVFVADALSVSASAVTGTFNCTGDAATGCIGWIGSQAGITRAGASAVRQFAHNDNVTYGTPSVTFGSSVITSNPTVVGFSSDDSSGTSTPPTGWTEMQDLNTAGLQVQQEIAVRASGFTGTTVTWGSSELDFCTVGIELDLSAAASARSWGCVIG